VVEAVLMVVVVTGGLMVLELTTTLAAVMGVWY
jgi:hypothetical protein